MTLQYEDIKVDEPQEGSRIVVIVLKDEQGVAGLPAFVTVTVTRRNDPPELSLGVGFGEEDVIEFSEIKEGDNGAGIQVVSLPHRVAIRDEEENTQQQFIQKMIIQLRFYSAACLDY